MSTGYNEGSPEWADDHHETYDYEREDDTDMEERGRHTWLFTYTLEELHAAALAKADHHTERLAYWTNEQAGREETLRTKGIDVTTIVQRGVASNTGYYGQPTLDVELARKYAEAQERTAHHRALLGEYERWVRVIDHQRTHGHPAQTRAMLATVEDVEFFGL